MNKAFYLNNKMVLVTGASSGIGKSIASECAEYGATLVITGRNEERLHNTFKSLPGEGHLKISAELNNEEDIKTFTDKLPQLDGVVHCAGINPKMPVKFISAEKIDQVMKVNFYAPSLIMQSLIRQKKLNKNASVVMISSIAATYATISNAVYASSKGALNSFLRVLALELAGQKIRVNGIQPGMVNTGILESYELKENLKEFEKEYPIGRFGKPEDIAFAAIYLLSDASEWVTGTSLTVDGGITLR